MNVVGLESPEDVPPWRKCALIHQAQAVERIDAMTWSERFHLEGARVGLTEVGDLPFTAWPPLRAGEVLRLRFSNESNEPRRLVVGLTLTRIE